MTNDVLLTTIIRINRTGLPATKEAIASAIPKNTTLERELRRHIQAGYVDVAIFAERLR